MAALIPIFLSNLPALLSAGESVYNFITQTKTVLSQDAAWTSAEDAQWQSSLIAAGKSPEWMG